MADQEMKFRATLDGDTLSPALDRIRASFDAVREATQRLETDLPGTGRAAEEVTRALGEEATGAQQAAATEQEAGSVRAAAAQATGEAIRQGMAVARGALEATAQVAKAAWGAITGGIGLLVDLGKGLLDNAEKTKQWQDTMDDTSGVLGISRQSMVEWNYAAAQTPLSTAQFTGALTHLETQMRATDTGYDKQKEQLAALQEKLTSVTLHIAQTGDAHGLLAAEQVKLENQITTLTEKIPRQAKAFADLGINIYDAAGHYRGIDALLPELADTFAGMADGPEKAALAVKLFGGAGTDMLEFLNKGSAGLEAYRQKAHDLGITITDDDIAANDKLIESQQALKQAWEGIEHKLGQAIIPLLADAASKAVPLIEGALVWAGHLKDALAPGLALVSDLIGRLFDAVAPLTDSLGLLLQGDWSGFGQKVGSVLHNLLNVIGDTISNLLNGAPSWGAGLVAQFSNGILEGIGSFLRPALDTVGGFITGLLEPHSPPPLLPHLDQWGADAASIYLHGWTQGDYSAFDSLAAAIKDHLASLLDSGAIGKLDLAPMLGSARAALQAAQSEFVQFGDVSASAIARLSATLGPGREALLAYIETTFALERADRATADAQAQLTAIQEGYKAQLDDVAAKVRQLAADEKTALGSLPDQIQAVQDRLAALGRESDAAIHPLDVQLHDLALQLKAVQAAGADALAPFTADLERAQAALRAVQAQSAGELDPLKDNIRQTQEALRDLQQAARDALAPFDDDLRAANSDLASLREQAQATMQGFLDQTQPLQAALTLLGQQGAAALAPIDEALDAAKGRVEAFKLASAAIAASYDAQLAPLLAQLHAVQDVELGKKHSEELHNMGLAVENLQARLQNAVPGSAEYIEIQKELAKAQGDLADKTAEYSADDKIKELQKEKEAALTAAKEKEDAAALDVTRLEQQRTEVQKTYAAQRAAIEGHLQDIQREQQVFQQAEQHREQAVQQRIAGIQTARQAVADAAQAEIDASQRSLEAQQRVEQARERAWATQAAQAQAQVATAQAAVAQQQTQTAAEVDAINRQIAPIQTKRDAVQYAAQEQARTTQQELTNLQLQEQAVTRRYDTEKAQLQATQTAIQDKQRVDEAAATATLKAAKDFADSLQAQSDAQHSLLAEQKNAADGLQEYDSALKAATGSHAAWVPPLTNTAGTTLPDLSQALAVARDRMHNLDDAQAAAGTGAVRTKGLFDTFLDGLHTKWDTVLGGLKAGMDDFNDRVQKRGLVGAIISEITDGWGHLLHWTGQLEIQVVQWVMTATPKLIIEIGRWAQGFLNYIANTALPDLVRSVGFLEGAALRWISDAATAVPGKIAEFWHAITSWFDQTGKPGIKAQGGHLIDSLFDGLKRLIEDGPKLIQGWVSHLADTLLAGFREGWGVHSPSTKMFEIAGHLMDGLLGGLDPSKVLAKIKDIAGDALGAFTKIFDSHSPSEETKKIGSFVLDGLVVGMDGGGAALDAAFARISTSFQTWKTDILAQSTAALGQLPPLWQTSLQGLLPVWDSLFGPEAGQEGTLLNRLWGHQATSFFTILVAYTRTKNDQWFSQVWVQVLDLLATRLTDYLRLKAAEIAVGGAEIGHQIMEGMAQQIRSDTHLVEAAIRDGVNAAIAAGQDEAESHSPSEKAARELGKPHAQGMAKGIRDGTGEVEAAARDQVRAAVGVGVPGGTGMPVGVPGGAGVPVGVPVGGGAGLAGAGALPLPNITFQITLQNTGGELRGPHGERPTDPLYWKDWVRAIRIAWFQQFGMTPEGRAL